MERARDKDLVYNRLYISSIIMHYILWILTRQENGHYYIWKERNNS